MGREQTNTVEREAATARRGGRLRLARSAAQLGDGLPVRARMLLSLQQTAGNRAVRGLVQRVNGPEKLVETKGGRFKKKKKERREQARVERTLDQQIHDWVEGYGHAIERHGGLTTAQLDARNIPLATTFDTQDDLFKAAKDLIGTNEQKLNNWYTSEEGERLGLWAYKPDNVQVRGRRKLARPDWHQHQTPMPPHPGFANDNNLDYVIGFFDRNYWVGNPKGLVTCYPSDKHL